MRSKVTLVLLFLNVALFFFIFYFERDWRIERASLEARRRVLGPEASDIRSLEVGRAGRDLRPRAQGRHLVPDEARRLAREPERGQQHHKRAPVPGARDELQHAGPGEERPEARRLRARPAQADRDLHLRGGQRARGAGPEDDGPADRRHDQGGQPTLPAVARRRARPRGRPLARRQPLDPARPAALRRRVLDPGVRGPLAQPPDGRALRRQGPAPPGRQPVVVRDPGDRPRRQERD